MEVVNCCITSNKYVCSVSQFYKICIVKNIITIESCPHLCLVFSFVRAFICFFFYDSGILIFLKEIQLTPNDH